MGTGGQTKVRLNQYAVSRSQLTRYSDDTLTLMSIMSFVSLVRVMPLPIRHLANS
jgi:hypothetical protein